MLLFTVVVVVVGRRRWRRVGEVTKVERVGGSGTSVTSVIVGIDEEHVLRWVLCRVRVRYYVVWIHKVKCLQPFSGGRGF